LNFDQRLAGASAGNANGSLEELGRQARAEFETALDDDLNTSAALAALFDFVRESNAALDRSGQASSVELKVVRETLHSLDSVLGLLDLARAHDANVDPQLAAWVEERIEARRAARSRRDFAEADRLRNELLAAGIIIEDTTDGTRWKRA
ncbi:MAG: DALR domain-containing protein, partial [Longimicrobiales bacterium]